MHKQIQQSVIGLGFLFVFIGGISLSGCAGKPIPVPEVSATLNSGETYAYTTQFKASRYTWVQKSGVRVEIESPKSVELKFTAPHVSEPATLVFSLKTIKTGAWKIPHTSEKVVVVVSP
ncbi:MAG: hypothetical protein GXO35_05485 [Gammaproteobacteria bacterium]|nr:hypothetical protein [Gammaproteobacteria bacterium]